MVIMELASRYSKQPSSKFISTPEFSDVFIRMGHVLGFRSCHDANSAWIISSAEEEP